MKPDASQASPKTWARELADSAVQSSTGNTQAPVQRSIHEQPNDPEEPADVDPVIVERLLAEERTRAIILRAMTASGRYRIVERFERRPAYHHDDGAPKYLGLCVDVETTGLDPVVDRIIQLAMTPFEYGPDGRIYGVDECITFIEDPGVPIPPAVTELTGIRQEDVTGRRIEDDRVDELLEATTLVVAHNAAFDRRFLERRLPAFCVKPWACSRRDVPWEAEGLQSTSLEWLAYKVCSMYYEAHRADSDCLMAVHLLAQTLPSGRRVMECLLESAHQPTVRVWATGAPFESKDVLKKRRYSWSDGTDGRPKAWWRDLREHELEAETEWLAANVYGGRAPRHAIHRFDALLRYSDRVGSTGAA